MDFSPDAVVGLLEYRKSEFQRPNFQLAERQRLSDRDNHQFGRRDANGYFWLAGRKKELIIRGGHNIDPKIIEDALQTHPAVAMSAAVGSPDAYAGEMPVAYVQPKPGATVTEQELLEHAARTIPERAAIPKRIKISSSLPTTAVGKLFKPALVEREIEETVRAEADRVGASVISVTVDRDPKLGLRAIVRAAADAGRLHRELLSRTDALATFESTCRGLLAI